MNRAPRLKPRVTMITALPLSERPRERCLSQGARALSLRECIAVILGSGTPANDCLGIAQELLDRPGAGLSENEQARALFTGLEDSAESVLIGVKGLGAAGRARLLAAFELGRRYENFRTVSRFRSPSAKARHSSAERALDSIPDELRSEPREWLGFVPIHRSGSVGDFCLVERGLRTHIHIDPVSLFSRVLALRPQAFYLFHNHPSGDMTPSPADLHLTREVQKAASLFAIRLLGHGIVSRLEERWIVL